MPDDTRELDSPASPERPTARAVVLAAALAAARELTDPHDRARALIRIVWRGSGVPHLPAVARQAWDAARDITDPGDRVGALLDLSDALKDPYFRGVALDFPFPAEETGRPA